MDFAPRSPLSSAVDGLCDRFERRLQAGERTTLEDWLTEAGAEAPVALPELAAVELDHRIRAGEAVTAADYFTRFPQLRTDPVWAVALVRVEYSAVRVARPSVPDRDILDRYADLSTHPEWGRGPWPVRGGAATTFTTSGPRADAPADTAVSTAPLLAPAREPGEIGRLAQYRVLKVLGQGGMGIVYEAEDTQLQRPAALKLMLPHLAQDPNARARFLAEARAAAKVTSDHVVTIYQIAEDGGSAFVAMELLRGESLEEWLKRTPVVPVRDLLRVAREIATGLAAAQTQGLVHRDIKPANIWIEAPTGRVKILDFGLARAVEPNARITQSGAVMGTPAYMSPEQAGAKAVDHRTDLFSLGAVMYRLATGKLPFPGTTAMAVLTALISNTPLPPVAENPELPPALSDLILKLLAKDRDQRPTTANEVVAALLELESQLSNRSKPSSIASTTAPAAPPKGSRRRVGAWIALGLAPMLLVAVVASVIIKIKGPDGKETTVEVPDGSTVKVDPRGQVEVVVPKGKDDPVPPPPKDGPKVPVPKPPVFEFGPVAPPSKGRLAADALVQAPAELPGVLGWTVETRVPRTGVTAGVPSHDAKRIATGHFDGTVRIWDAATLTVERILIGKPGYVAFLGWLPDNKSLIVGPLGAMNAAVWDTTTGRRIAELPKGYEYTYAKLSPSGKYLLLPKRGADKSHVLDLATGKPLPLTVPYNGGETYSWRGDDGLIGQRNGKITLYRGILGEPELTLFFGPKKGSLVAISPDGKCAIFADETRHAVWDIDGQKEVGTFVTDGATWGGDRSRQYAWTRDGKTLCVAATNPGYGLNRFTFPEGKPVGTPIKKDEAQITVFRTAGDDGWGVIDGYGGPSPGRSTIRVFDDTGKMVRQVAPRHSQYHDGRTVVEGQDGRSVFHVFNRKTLFSLDLATGSVRSTELNSGAHRGHLSPDGTKVLCIAFDGITLIDVKTNAEKLIADGPMFNKLVGCSAVIWKDGNTPSEWLYFAYKPVEKGQTKPYFARFDFKTGREKEVPLEKFDVLDAARDMQLSPDGSRLLVRKYGAKDKATYFSWDTATGKATALATPFDDVPAHSNSGIIWSPDGRSAIVLHTKMDEYEKGTAVGLWTADKPNEIRFPEAGRLQPITSANWKVAVAPDGVSLAAITHDKDWQAAGIRYLAAPEMKPGPLHVGGSVNNTVGPWLADGKVLTGDDTHGVRRFWDTRTGAPLATWAFLSDAKSWDSWLLVSANGHFKCSDTALETHIVYVVQTEDGVQHTLTPTQFADKYGWKNDPDKVRSLPPEEKPAQPPAVRR